jgi:DNA-binding HxlR family transcriptional regulator
MMDEEKEEQFFKLITSKGARDILKHLNERETTQHADLNAFMNTSTLNTKLHELLTLDLIEHHLDKSDMRKEWYTITEKGKKILQYVDDMIKTVF